ncbi:protein trichome birefringence-like 34 [Typha latifolia]|uniref:protein trichome birefringence-like 34 n=1 Tax=Typha latifolia TaxID=4733 RepID=UPI003C306A05
MRMVSPTSKAMHYSHFMTINAAKILNHLSRTQSKRTNMPLRGGEEEEEDEEFEGGGIPKKSQNGLRTWGLRGHFNSIVVFLVAVCFILVVSLTNKNGGWYVAPAAAVKDSIAEKCDLFTGRWVYEEKAYPLYSEKGCRFMSDQSACEKFGRVNLKHQNWRWQPNECNLPRFNATKLLEKLRGRRLVFVGDSLNRNQWISMVCLLDASIAEDDHKTMETNGSLMSFKIKDYNASIDFYWAPLLVESNSDDPVHHRIPDRIVRAESIQKHARHWSDADILVFNSYLWWRRDQMKVLWGSFDDEDGIYKEIEGLRGYELALQTWSEWLEFHVDHQRTQLFFMSMSPTHFWGDEWGIGSDQNCYNETEPISRYGHRGRDSDSTMMQVVEETIQGLKHRGVSVQMLNITQLSEYRKDGHPSIFRKQWEPLTDEQLKNPSSYADCIHWCLPGVPDVWNEILYAYILFR